MSRLRKTNRKLLKIGIDDFPIGTDEQDALIESLEQHDIVHNKTYRRIFFICFLIMSIIYPYIFGRNPHKKELSPFLSWGGKSILFSSINFISKDEQIYKYLKGIMNIFNIIFLLAYNWKLKFYWEELSTLMVIILEIPILLFIVSLLIRTWETELDDKIEELRGLKYQYKNV